MPFSFEGSQITSFNLWKNTVHNILYWNQNNRKGSGTQIHISHLFENFIILPFIILIRGKTAKSRSVKAEIMKSLYHGSAFFNTIFLSYILALCGKQNQGDPFSTVPSFLQPFSFLYKTFLARLTLKDTTLTFLKNLV